MTYCKIHKLDNCAICNDLVELFKPIWKSPIRIIRTDGSDNYQEYVPHTVGIHPETGEVVYMRFVWREAARREASRQNSKSKWWQVWK